MAPWGNTACWGINACKGQSACSTAFNACTGQNSCKGRGYLNVPAKECKAKGGQPLKGSAADPVRLKATDSPGVVDRLTFH